MAADMAQSTDWALLRMFARCHCDSYACLRAVVATNALGLLLYTVVSHQHAVLTTPFAHPFHPHHFTLPPALAALLLCIDPESSCTLRVFAAIPGSLASISFFCGHCVYIDLIGLISAVDGVLSLAMLRVSSVCQVPAESIPTHSGVPDWCMTHINGSWYPTTSCDRNWWEMTPALCRWIPPTHWLGAQCVGLGTLAAFVACAFCCRDEKVYATTWAILRLYIGAAACLRVWDPLILKAWDCERLNPDFLPPADSTVYPRFMIIWFAVLALTTPSARRWAQRRLLGGEYTTSADRVWLY